MKCKRCGLKIAKRKTIKYQKKYCKRAFCLKARRTINQYKTTLKAKVKAKPKVFIQPKKVQAATTTPLARLHNLSGDSFVRMANQILAEQN